MSGEDVGAASGPARPPEGDAVTLPILFRAASPQVAELFGSKKGVLLASAAEALLALIHPVLQHPHHEAETEILGVHFLVGTGALTIYLHLSSP